ncbi:XdhC family protein [Paludibacterium yongneupense]|uniref:XdhC family protein n=1 Tax=Paludibacterium yongneupense TaxID=400061 RepID=UPI0003FA104D|nr:XdhC/CoxI family protein [Paludibacterium yongneupense]
MDIYEEIVRLRQEGRNGALATIVNTQGSIPSYTSAKMLVRDDGSIAGTVGGGGAELEAIRVAAEVIEQEKPRTISFDLNKQPGLDAGMVCGGSLEIYIEPLVAAPKLYIFGAGHTGLATYRVAQPLGFDVVVIDERVAFANRERFPDAVGIVTDELDAAMAHLTIKANSYIFIVTTGHQIDMRILRWATGTQARYIGMIGSRRKVTGIFHELQKEGIPAERFHNVHAPVGLDIGAQTPEEIAISVMAEMIACRRGSEASLPHLGLAATPARETLLEAAG